MVPRRTNLEPIVCPQCEGSRIKQEGRTFKCQVCGYVFPELKSD